MSPMIDWAVTLLPHPDSPTHGDGFVAVYGKGDVIDSLDDAIEGVEVGGETFNFEELFWRGG